MTSFDMIGTIAVLEIPKGLEKKGKLMARSLLASHKNIKTVMKKAGGHTGTYRLQKLTHIAGERTTETLHRENGVSIKLDIRKVYFSPRLATERLRIARKIKEGEEILAMFAGCGPYPLVIAKNSKAKKIVAVEINPLAVKYADENIKLNKITNISNIKGDVKKVVPTLKKKFDRVIMPLPKGAETFLPQAIAAVKKRGMLHFYDFLKEGEIPEKGIEKIEKALKGKKYKIEEVVRCGQLAPRAYRVCFDIRAL